MRSNKKRNTRRSNHRRYSRSNRKKTITKKSRRRNRRKKISKKNRRSSATKKKSRRILRGGMTGQPENQMLKRRPSAQKMAEVAARMFMEAPHLAPEEKVYIYYYISNRKDGQKNGVVQETNPSQHQDLMDMKSQINMDEGGELLSFPLDTQDIREFNIYLFDTIEGYESISVGLSGLVSRKGTGFTKERIKSDLESFKNRMNKFAGDREAQAAAKEQERLARQNQRNEWIKRQKKESALGAAPLLAGVDTM